MQPFEVTYISHESAGSPAVQEWMQDPFLVGRQNMVSDKDLFDHVLVSSGLPDTSRVYSAEEFGKKLGMGVLSIVLALVCH